MAEKVVVIQGVDVYDTANKLRDFLNTGDKIYGFIPRNNIDDINWSDWRTVVVTYFEYPQESLQGREK